MICNLEETNELDEGIVMNGWWPEKREWQTPKLCDDTLHGTKNEGVNDVCRWATRPLEDKTGLEATFTFNINSWSQKSVVKDKIYYSQSLLF